jgi:hypothetical protein
MTDTNMTRRGFVGAAAVAIPAAAIFGSREAAAQANLPKLSLTDPVAKALLYTENAATVDKSKAPTFKPGSNCNNCAQIQGAAGDWRPCAAFPGKLVAAQGWCSAWIEKKA